MCTSWERNCLSWCVRTFLRLDCSISPHFVSAHNVQLYVDCSGYGCYIQVFKKLNFEYNNLCYSVTNRNVSLISEGAFRIHKGLLRLEYNGCFCAVWAVSRRPFYAVRYWTQRVYCGRKRPAMEEGGHAGYMTMKA